MTLFGRLIQDRVQRRAHVMRASQFAAVHPSAGSVAFIGDSITAGGLWHEWFPGVAVINRGIDGDTAEGVLARLDTALTGPPERVFLLIGTNDLSLRRKPAEISGRVALIVDAIGAAAPESTIVLQSVMPRDAKYRNRLIELNDYYRAVSRDHRIRYLDLWPVLADSHGCLRADYTLDNLHLGGAGYQAWVNVLKTQMN